MTDADILEIIAEEQQVQRHQEALDSLLGTRTKLLREPLDERMRRAQDCGEWTHLSEPECAALHQEEKRYLKSQVDRLRREQARTRGLLAELRRRKKRAKRIRAAQVESEQKRH